MFSYFLRSGSSTIDFSSFSSSSPPSPPSPPSPSLPSRYYSSPSPWSEASSVHALSPSPWVWVFGSSMTSSVRGCPSLSPLRHPAPSRTIWNASVVEASSLATSGDSGSDSNRTRFTLGESVVTRIFVAGAIAGFVAEACMHPIDTIRARLMVQHVFHRLASFSPPSISSPTTTTTTVAPLSVREGSSSVARPPPLPSSPLLYRGAWDALVRTLREEGVRALYRGSGIVMMSSAPMNALYFGGYEFTKSFLLERNGPSPSQTQLSSIHLVSGITADILAALLGCPVEIIKQRLQVERTPRKIADGTTRSRPSYQNFFRIQEASTFRIAREIWLKSGVQGFYQGFLASCLTHAPFSAVFFAVYEYGKTLFQKWRGEDASTHFWFTVLNGSFSGSVAAASTTPFDVIRTRLQVQQSGPQRLYLHPADALVKIVASEGVLGLFQGISARVLWLAPTTAITIVVYEVVRNMLGLEHLEEDHI